MNLTDEDTDWDETDDSSDQDTVNWDDICAQTSMLKHPKELLTREEERRLLTILSNKCNHDEATLEKAHDELVSKNIGFVISEVNKIIRQQKCEYLREDLIQEGLLGLMHSINNFDVNRANRLITYAKHWIRKLVYEAIDKQMKFRRHVEKKKDIDSKLKEDVNYITIKENVVDIDSSVSPEEAVDHIMIVERVINSNLSEKNKDILYRRYGVNGQAEESVKSIAASYGISSEAINRRVKHSLEELRLAPTKAKVIKIAPIKTEKKEKARKSIVDILKPTSIAACLQGNSDDVLAYVQQRTKEWLIMAGISFPVVMPKVEESITGGLKTQIPIKHLAKKVVIGTHRRKAQSIKTEKHVGASKEVIDRALEEILKERKPIGRVFYIKPDGTSHDENYALFIQVRFNVNKLAKYLHEDLVEKLIAEGNPPLINVAESTIKKYINEFKKSHPNC